MVFKYRDRQQEDGSSMVYKTPSKFLIKSRHDASQYASANSSMAGQELLYAKYTGHDIQEEFVRLYTQLELLKERNMRVGNRHLATKITAMTDAAKMCDNDNEKSSIVIRSSSSLCVSAERSVTDEKDEPSVKIKRQSVSFAVDANKSNDSNTHEVVEDAITIDNQDSIQPQESDNEKEESSSTYPSDNKKESTDSNGRHLMSGHARTHSIVINLDDKSRFTDEITV